jgi:hypothetical protein
MEQNPNGTLNIVEVDFWHSLCNGDMRWKHTMKRLDSMLAGELEYTTAFAESNSWESDGG